MMNELIERLEAEPCSLAILHDGEITTYEGRGARRLYDLLADCPEILYRSKVAAKTVGQTAARSLIDGGIDEVHAVYISETALHSLEAKGIRVSYDHRLDHAGFLRIWERMGE